jgi:hypothetical protein
MDTFLAAYMICADIDPRSDTIASVLSSAATGLFGIGVALVARIFAENID